MAKLVQIARGVAVNPDMVASVRGDDVEFYVEMSNGTRHVLHNNYLGVIRALNGGTR